MPRHRKLTLAAGVALALIAAALLWQRAKGPTHEGKTVEEWFRSYLGPDVPGSTGSSPLQQMDAEKAFVALGNNAVPYLAERITQDTAFSKVELWRIKVHDVLPPALNPLVSLPREPSRKESDATFAAYLLSEHVHPPAELLVPLLEPVLNGTNVTQQITALSTLKGVTGDRKLVLPYLVKALESTNQNVLATVSHVMSSFKVEEWADLDVTTAVSNLTVRANNTVPTVAVVALQSLGRLGTNASSAVPALQEMLAKETNAHRRKLVTNALEKIQPPKAAQ